MEVNKEELKELIRECMAELLKPSKKDIYIEYTTIYDDSLIREDFEKAQTLMYRLHNIKNLKTIKCVNKNNKEQFDCVEMFAACDSLTNIDLSEFDTSNVTDMSYMFSSCSSLTSLDLSHFDTRNVLDMDAMFRCCYELKELNISSFDMQNVRCINDMFNETPLNLNEKMKELYGSK